MINSLIFIFFLCIFCSFNLFPQNSSKSWKSLEENDSLVIHKLSINSKYNDYSPVYINNILYFTSDRRNKYTNEAALRFNSSIYRTRKIESDWEKPKMCYFFNSDDYTAIAGYHFAGVELYTYKTINNGSLYFSGLNEKGQWTRPQQFKPPIRTENHQQSITQTDDLIVISSYQSGENKYDLFWTRKGSVPVEFFPISIVNSPANEIDVSFAPDGKTLYFSSNRDKENSGFDIYYTIFDENHQWTPPVNLGEVVNTYSDERWFADYDSVFFFSSNRFDDNDYFNIYMGYIISPPIDTVIDVEQMDTIIVETIEKEIIEEKIIDEIIEVIEGDEIIEVTEEDEETYFAYVQIGAYYKYKSIEEFKNNFIAFDTTDIFMETLETKKGPLNRFIINQKYYTLEEATLRQREAIKQQKDKINKEQLKHDDVIIAVYNKAKERVMIYFDVEKNLYLILKGDKRIIF